MPANLIESIGYSLGKIHVGMIAYLCNLYSDGITGPLENVANSLEIALPKNPCPRREFPIGNRMKADIVIGNLQIREDNAIIIEIKIDDHEWERESGWQTRIYADRVPEQTQKLFITLGHGEFYHAPHDDSWTWIRLPKFHEAVDNIARKFDNIYGLQEWASALRNELRRRAMVIANDRTEHQSFRPGSWNVTFLGNLKENFEQMKIDSDIDCSCYTYGQAPDTILNFGWSQDPVYAEINNNGTLNVKVAFGNAGQEDRQRIYHDAVCRINTAIEPEPTINPCNEFVGTMTLISLNIEIINDAGAMRFRISINDTIQILKKYIEQIYRV